MEEKIKLDWKTYEFITKFIYETLGKDYRINIEGYGNDCKIKGNSGVKHQIDILTSETDGVDFFRTAIECKYWNKKVTKDTVMKLLATINDTNIDRGIIVSKSGYTRDAQQFAKFNNILIVQLKETATEDNIDEEIFIGDLELNIQTRLRRPQVISIIATDIENNKIVLQEMDQYRILMASSDNEKSRLFNKIMIFKKYLHEQKPYDIVFREYLYEKLTLHFDENSYKIKSLAFTGMLTVCDENQTKQFSIIDKVWLIMKKIFEQQTFIISENGLIINSPA